MALLVFTVDHIPRRTAVLPLPLLVRVDPGPVIHGLRVLLKSPKLWEGLAAVAAVEAMPCEDPRG